MVKFFNKSQIKNNVANLNTKSITKNLHTNTTATNSSKVNKSFNFTNNDVIENEFSGNISLNEKDLKDLENVLLEENVNSGKLIKEEGKYILDLVLSGDASSDIVFDIEKLSLEDKEFLKKLSLRKKAEETAQEFTQVANDSSGKKSLTKMQELLKNKITPSNITAFLDAYEKEQIELNDSSIIDTIVDESFIGNKKQKIEILNNIMDTLCDAARQHGVSEESIHKAKQDFDNSLNEELKSLFKNESPQNMEKAIDFLRGEIATKANNENEISEEEAIERFNELFNSENEAIQTNYADARKEYGWITKLASNVGGLFGNETISDMDKKLDSNNEAVKKLTEAKTEDEFKKIYKEIFGIEFDKNKISAIETAIDKYHLANDCISTIQITNNILKSSDSYSNLKAAIQKNFQYDDSIVDEIVKNYADEENIQNPSEEQKKELLIKFLNETKTNATENIKETTNGKTLEQMEKDIELITRSAFGTNDIAKDLIHFDHKQQVSGIVAEAAFEIAGTVALQFVPGAGQVAAAKLATSAARWGGKATKIAKIATKAEKTFSTLNKIQKGGAIANATSKTSKVVNSGIQVATQMSFTGLATTAVDLSNGKSVKEATKKALLNMSFSGVGATSSVLAPKIMSSFGIVDRAIANEIAEELLNVAGTYGITKLNGEDYGSSDAFVDFASGLIIARLSHIKVAKVKKTSIDSKNDLAQNANNSNEKNPKIALNNKNDIEKTSNSKTKNA